MKEDLRNESPIQSVPSEQRRTLLPVAASVDTPQEIHGPQPCRRRKQGEATSGQFGRVAAASYTASPTPTSHRPPAPVCVQRQRSPRAIRRPLEQVRRLVDPAPTSVREVPVERQILSPRQGIRRRFEGVVGGPSIHFSRPRAVPSVGSALAPETIRAWEASSGRPRRTAGRLFHFNAVVRSAPQTTATPEVD